ncbi:MAG: hypothetical protein AAFP90_06675 [Planctomycetota bacterium]
MKHYAVLAICMLLLAIGANAMNATGKQTIAPTPDPVPNAQPAADATECECKCECITEDRFRVILREEWRSPRTAAPEKQVTKPPTKTTPSTTTNRKVVMRTYPSNVACPACIRWKQIEMPRLLAAGVTIEIDASMTTGTAPQFVCCDAKGKQCTTLVGYQYSQTLLATVRE